MHSKIMIQHASEIGANAIIGMRYDTTEISTGVTEVIAYGTGRDRRADRFWLSR